MQYNIGVENSKINKKVDLSIVLNIALIAVMIVGLFYVFLNAPTQYLIGSLFTRPQAVIVEDVMSGAFTVEYLNAFEEKEVKAGAKGVSIGEFNLRSTYEPIDVNSLNFVFESGGKEDFEKLNLFVDGDLYEEVEWIWLDDLTLSLSFGAKPLIVEDLVSLDVRADLAEIESEIIMHFAFADLTGEKTGKNIVNQGIISETPDPKPQSIIIK